MILAIDTATEFAGLALYDADTVWAEEIWHAARNHTVELMPRLHRMLQKATLDAASLDGIAVCVGPGSYTGVRIGVAAAKGLALPHNLPLAGVPTLDIAAYPHRRHPLPVVAIARAGRRRILTARYRRVEGAWRQTAPSRLTTFADLAAALTEPALLAGEFNAEEADFLRRHAPARIEVVGPPHRVRRPAVLAELGALKLANHEADDVHHLAPIYLKEP